MTGIVLSGAIAQVRGFADELGQTLGYDVVAREVDAGDDGGWRVAPCRLAVAAGLSVAEVPAMRAVNLLPTQRRHDGLTSRR